MQPLKTTSLTPEERQVYQARYDDLELLENMFDLTDEQNVEMARLYYILNPGEQYWREFAPNMDVLEAIQ